jgi:hypothetical protein
MLSLQLPRNQTFPFRVSVVAKIDRKRRSEYLCSVIVAVTFLEGASNIIVPTQTFAIPADDGQSETIVLYQSCAVGQGGVADCLVSEAVAFSGSTIASAATQTVTISAVTLNANPSGGNSPSQSGSSPLASQPTSAPGSKPSDSGSSTASAPTTSNSGAASRVGPQTGLAAFVGSLLILL